MGIFDLLSFFLNVCVRSTNTTDPTLLFENFCKKFNKSYASSTEAAHRLAIFKENLVSVKKMNEEHVALGGDEVFGITAFTDLTVAEFKAMYLNYKAPSPEELKRIPRVRRPPLKETKAIKKIDWRNKNCITEIKNQGQCGSCWAFSATEIIESYAYLLNGTKTLKNLSTQQITSCTRDSGACQGGRVGDAFEYLQSIEGLETEADYPYVSGGGKSPKCQYDASKAKVAIKGWKDLEIGEFYLHEEVASWGPPSVVIAAQAFQHYTSGILRHCVGTLDHCVQVVGFDLDNDPPYWIVRNSWGDIWGEKGYIRIEKGKELCLIGSLISFAFP